MRLSVQFEGKGYDSGISTQSKEFLAYFNTDWLVLLWCLLTGLFQLTTWELECARSSIDDGVFIVASHWKELQLIQLKNKAKMNNFIEDVVTNATDNPQRRSGSDGGGGELRCEWAPPMLGRITADVRLWNLSCHAKDFLSTSPRPTVKWIVFRLLGVTGHWHVRIVHLCIDCYCHLTTLFSFFLFSRPEEKANSIEVAQN
jgi:hypothetical protein